MIRLLLGAAGLAILAGCLTPQDEAYGIRTLKFTDLSGHVDLVIRQQERELKSKRGATTTSSKETIFEESLSLETKGYMFHPNVVELALGGVFGLVQEDFEDVIDQRKRDSRNSGDLLEFDFEAGILKKSAQPVTVFAHRRRGLLPRPFLPSLDTSTTNYGFTWQSVSKKNPASLQLSHTDSKLSPLFVAGNTEQDGRQKTTELRFETDYIFSDSNTLSLVYEHRSVSEEPFELEYDADEITVSHRYEWGDEQQHRLDSEFDYLDQRGTINIERVRWREDLRLKHSDTLQSQFLFEALDRTYQGRSRDVPGVKERSLRLSGSLRHQLYQSQTMQVRVFVQKQEFEPNLDITRWGGTFNCNYRKTNRWGVLNADYSFRFEQTDHRGANRTSELIDETHTFRGPDPIILGNRNVSIASITVRAEDRVTFYRRGRDFRVSEVGNLVELERVPTGRIADGETVLIDYLFHVGGNFELDSIWHSLSIRQNFDSGWLPYYQFRWQDQTISPSGATDAVAEDITDHVVGVEYQKGPLRLFAEYEDRDSTINPFTSSRFGASFSHRMKSGAETSVQARWTDTSHDPPNERVLRLFSLETRLRHPITPALTLEGSLLYRNGDDSLVGDTEEVDVSLSVEWFVRRVKVRVSLEHSEFEDRFAWNDSTTLFVHLRRGL